MVVLGPVFAKISNFCQSIAEKSLELEIYCSDVPIQLDHSRNNPFIGNYEVAIFYYISSKKLNIIMQPRLLPKVFALLVREIYFP